MTSQDANLKNFVDIFLTIPTLIAKYVPIMADTAKILGFKLEAASDLAPEKLCAEFVNALKPYASLLIAQDDAFFLEHFQHIIYLKDFDQLPFLWQTADHKFKKELWRKLNSAFTFATLANNSQAAAPLQGINFSGEGEFDASQLGETVQQMMPAVLSMLGPMMQGLSGGKTKAGAAAAASPDNPMMQALAGMIGGPPPSHGRQRATQERAKLKAKVEERKKKKANVNSLI